MAPIVKICGLSTAETLEAALTAGADMVGFVFFPKSPRHLAYETARALGRQARGRARIVALSVDADDDALSRILEALSPDILQLHGRESPARVKEIGERCARPTMKAIGVAAREDLAAADALRGRRGFPADRRQAGRATRSCPAATASPSTGGSRATFRRAGPGCFPAASIPSMSREAIARTGARGVDVSSGVESAPGVKDVDRIRAFVAAARASLRPRDRRG